MSFLQLVLWLLDLLRSLTSGTKEEFESSPSAIGDGTFLTWLWENREKIAELLLLILEKLTGQPRTTIMQAVQEDNVSAVQTLDLKEHP